MLVYGWAIICDAGGTTIKQHRVQLYFYRIAYSFILLLIYVIILSKPCDVQLK